MNVVSGSTTTGVTDDNFYISKTETRFDFCTDVKFCPVVFDLTDIKTFPYSGVPETPVDTS